MPRKADALVLLSGGIDSTTVLAAVRAEGRTPITVTFDYGQTLSYELEVAARNSERYRAAAHFQIPLDLGPVAAKCALIAGSPVPLPLDRTLHEIDNGGTPPSYVPFRNGIFFAYLIAMGEAMAIENIYAGCNGLLSGQYYDDTAEFAKAFAYAGQVGTAKGYLPMIHVPYAFTDKATIVDSGLQLGVDYRETYSCYANARPHCGRCDSCKERGIALAVHGLNLEGKPIGAAVQS